MRFNVALAALALTGSLELTAAKKQCNKPSSGLVPTGTATGDPSTITGGLQPRGVQNLLRNGNFVGYDPSAPGGLYGYEIDGDGEARQVSGLGYTGDGSQETACAYLTVGPPKNNTTNNVDKRDVLPDRTVSIKQYLQDTDRESVYTMRVWYYVDMNEKPNTCKLVATYDDGLLVESAYFPVVAANSGSFSWTALVQESPLISVSGYLKFEVRCSEGGSAAVRFDQVFFTNEVSLRDLNDITVIYSAFADASTAPPTVSSTAPIAASTTSNGASSATAVSSAVSGTGTSTTASGSSSGSGASATAGGSGSVGTTTTSSSAAASSTSFGDNICVTLGGPSIAGRGCAKRPYSGSSGYKQYSSDGTIEQCAALCLNDPRCLSFQFNTKNIGCANGCYLLETSLAENSANNGGGDSNWAYDRSCIAQTQCSTTVPENSVCMNVEGSTPGADCTSNFNGQAKACATPFITTSVSPICGANACRDVCYQYSSCKSFSYTVTGGQNCRLYSEAVGTVATSTGANYLTFFTDRTCNACGTGMAHFKYVTKLADPAGIPVLDCPAPSSTAISAASTSSTSSTAAASSTILASTTTAAPAVTSTAAAMDTCPGGQSCTAKLLVPANVYCKSAGQFNLDIGAWLPDSAKFPGKPTSAEQCAAICSQTKNCNSSAFSPTRGCSLIAETLAQGQFSPSVSTDTSELWSDNACFTCAQCDSTSSTAPLTTTTQATPAVTSTAAAASSTGACNGSLGCKVKSYAPAGVYCKQVGEFNLDIAAWLPDTTKFPNKATSPEECAAICRQTTKCNSSSFSASRGICELMAETLAQGQFVPSSGSGDGYVKSDNACFDCTACGSDSSSGLSTATTPTPTTTTAPSSTTDGCPSWLAGPGGCFHSTPFPSGSTCYERGRIPEANVYTYSAAQQPNQRGFSDCAWICFNDPNCKAYGWVSTPSSSCKFSTQSLDGQLTKDTASDTAWFNSNCPQCWSCPDKAPISTKTPVSITNTQPTLSTPTTFDTRTTPASSSTDLNTSVSTDPIIPYPQLTGTSTAPTTTTSAPIAAQTCTAPAASLSDDNTCGIPAVGGQQLQSARLDSYVIKPVGSLANCAKECLARADCLGFSYSKTDTVCRPYRVGTTGLGLTYTPTETTRFYDRSCFTCTA